MIDIDKLKNVERVHNLATFFYHKLDELLILPDRKEILIRKALVLIPLKDPDKLVYSVDEYFFSFFNLFRDHIQKFRKIEQIMIAYDYIRSMI